MKVRRWLRDKSCAVLLFLFRMLGVHEQMGPSKADHLTARKGISLVQRLGSLQFLT